MADFNRFIYEDVKKNGGEDMKEQEAVRLVDCYSDMILRLSLNYLKSRQEAEDICQDVFMKYISADTVFPSQEQEKAWIIRTTINACKDHLKSAYHKRMVVTDHVQDDLLQEEDSFGDVREAVFSLPLKYRIIIYLYYFEGYSVKEIAKMLGKTQNAVSLNLVRGRRMLRKMIEQERKGWSAL